MCVANEIMLTTSLVSRILLCPTPYIQTNYSPRVVIKSPHLDPLQAGESNALRSIIGADSIARLALFRRGCAFPHLMALTFFVSFSFVLSID